jgi:hypothetical protein
MQIIYQLVGPMERTVLGPDGHCHVNSARESV